MSSSQPVRRNNRGGGYVEELHVIGLPDGGHRLEFRAPAGVVTQVGQCDPSYICERAVATLGLQRLRSARHAPTRATWALMTALGQVLTLPVTDNVDFALALDRYKTPTDGVDPAEWPRTATADYVHRGKYWYKTPSTAEKRRECGLALVELLFKVIDQHPVLGHVDSVAAVPGHDPLVVSFGARLAHAIAQRIGATFIRCSGPPGFRTPAKDLAPAELATAINGTFHCPTNATNQSVLIVDDVYRSGVTTAETARALRHAGAQRVAVLCPARTMRTF